MPNNKALFGPANLVFADIPTPFALPFGLAPLKKGQQSGLIFPSVGFNGANSSFYIQNIGYYLGLGPYSDLQINSDAYLNGDFRLGLQTQYFRRYRFRGNLAVQYSRFSNGYDEASPQFARNSDFNIRSNFNIDPKLIPGITFNGNINIVTKGFNQRNSRDLNSLANNATSLIMPPYTNGQQESLQIELVNLNKKWLDEKKYRKGKLKFYVNGKLIYTIEDFEEIIPRGLNTDKERQVGVPFNVSWGGGTQGLRENLVFSSVTEPYGPYIQDPECFPINDLTGTTFNGLKTNIQIEQNFAGTFEGAISQFRMYTNPLDFSQIQHNYRILKDRFDLIDFWCLDCLPVFYLYTNYNYLETQYYDPQYYE
jgi:hypothetical protein